MDNEKKINPVRNKKSKTSVISNGIKIAFFGTPEFAVDVLEELKSRCPTPTLLPSLIITAPDRPVGRKLVMTPPPMKIWADENNIPTLQPEKLDEDFLSELKKSSSNFLSQDWDLFIVAAYGKIIPPAILSLPKYGTLNIHPSLLPKYRGATPIHSAILAGEKETGVSLILMDEKMDHGAIVAQEKITLWENSISEMPTKSRLEKALAQLGGKLLGNTIPKWVSGEIKVVEQNHSEATFCKKLKSDDALIDLGDDAKENFLKIQAFDKWPKAHFFQNPIKNKTSNGASRKRIIIKKARLENDELIIERILPEGGIETNYLE